MVALIVGVILIAFCVFAVIPASLCGFGLDWSREVIDFLKGFARCCANRCICICCR